MSNNLLHFDKGKHNFNYLVYYAFTYCNNIMCVKRLFINIKFTIVDFTWIYNIDIKIKMNVDFYPRLSRHCVCNIGRRIHNQLKLSNLVMTSI